MTEQGSGKNKEKTAQFMISTQVVH